MSFCYYHLRVLSLLLFLFLGINNAMPELEEYKTYIVHMDHSHKPSSFLTHESWHRATLRALSNPVDDKEMLLYSYNHAMQGFSARLTPSQVSEIKKSPAHIAIHEERFGRLFTTHSPQFLGLKHSSGLWNASSYGEGVIIGMIDSGVWPESESFNEKGMPPIPTRWKGKCQNSTSHFRCNKKLIGAQVFIKGIQAAGKTDSRDDSPRDFLGHGTHTSSTAAGNHVPGASQFGYAKGTARGIAPRAHVAMYKVSSGGYIVESDVLAAMDQAVADGVDIMSLSLGFDQTPYFQDIIAIASLSAIEKGIVVVCSAGNDGAPNTTHNAAPWITTVGAGTLDRSFSATVTLGNDLTFEGKSEFPDRVIVGDTPLYYGKGDFNKTICSYGALNESEVFGKVVICDNTNRFSIFEQADELARVSAAAGILMEAWTLYGVDGLSIPSLVLPTSSGALIRKYAIGAAGEAKVKIMRFVLTSFGTKPAPQVAEFSSKGPDPLNPNILKPDIIAPGVRVLAAVPPIIPVGILGNHELASDYALFSGTSMSAPHVAGVAALLKAVHPEWSPAAIRSALMTTADTIDNNGTTLTNELTNLPGTPLDFGAGHINPNKAMNPGLIYDIDWQGYVDFLCGLGYNDTEMRAILRQSQWNCSQEGTDLNYPSFVAIFSKNASSPNVKNFTRVVTNVGDDQSVYQAIAKTTNGMSIIVEPTTLTFTSKYQKQSYVVSVQMDGKAPPVAYGYLNWVDQNSHIVASPVVVLNF
ncbi:subtilisin-like protease SBT1.7 [Durio zibethinus]|uniref:Subtilisin-like protease SBT1.7 n=1 Tax=Durio zibethinus TaxID=66656 RepID=A0A6P6ANN2_DURZI|nr:subtilisin-like protease SBT1.7 [Durio zibethinus]